MPSLDDGEQVWLETQPHHFSEGAIGKLIPKLSDDNLPNSEYKDSTIFKSGMPLLMGLRNKRHLILGNATQVDVTSRITTCYMLSYSKTMNCKFPQQLNTINIW